MAVSMARTTYTPKQRADALALYREHGPAEAGRHTGIPAGTISKWAQRQGLVPETTAKNAAAVEAAKLTYEQRRTALADALLADADRLRKQMWEETKVVYWAKDGTCHMDEIEEPTFADKQRIMTATGIAIDKAQLLHGDATARTETVEDPQRRAELLARIDELAARRAQRSA